MKNYGLFTHFHLLAAIAATVLSVSACNKDGGADTLTNESAEKTAEISLDEALGNLSLFLEQTGNTTTKSGSTKVFSSIETHRAADGTPDAYLVHFNDSEGFAVLGAKEDLPGIIAVTESGSLSWDEIFANAESTISAADNQKQNPDIIISRLIKNGITRGGGGIPGPSLPGDDPSIPFPPTPPSPPGGGTYIAPLTNQQAYDQTVSYCHKDNGGFILCGCAATALAIISSYLQFPSLYVDGSPLDYNACNSLDGVCVAYTFYKMVHNVLRKDKTIHFSLPDYYHNYTDIPVSTMDQTQLKGLLSTFDHNVFSVHGEPTISYPVAFPRSQFRLLAAMHHSITHIVKSWDATGALPTKVKNGLTDLGYTNVTYTEKDSLTNGQFNTIKTMLQNNKPVLMCGWSLWHLNESHYWIVDGVDTRNQNSLIHCNWGWGGHLNGWFTTNCIRETEGYQYDNPNTSASGEQTGNGWNHLIVYSYNLPQTAPPIRNIEVVQNMKTMYNEN